MDIVTTIEALKRGATEGNPVNRFIIDHHGYEHFAFVKFVTPLDFGPLLNTFDFNFRKMTLNQGMYCKLLRPISLSVLSYC